MLPGQLVDLASQQRYAFSKIRVGHVDLLQHFARFKLYLAQTRSPHPASTLKQFAIVKDQSLCISLGVMVPCVNYFVTVLRNSSLSRIFVAGEIWTSLAIEAGYGKKKHQDYCHSFDSISQ